MLRKSERGELTVAQAEAERAFRRYSSKNPEWAWRFRVFDAHVLVLQGQYSNALQLLNEDLPSSLTSTDIAVQRTIVRARAEAYLQKLDDSERDLANAEALAKRIQPALLAEVAQARSILNFFREDFRAMERNSRAAAAMAHEAHNAFLEARALGSLVLALMRQERYDESIEEQKIAMKIFESLGNRDYVANLLGNTGWNYYNVGDLEQALSVFQRAAQMSGETGSMADRLHWLISMADVYLAQRDFQRAQDAYNDALSVAKKMGDQKALVECLEYLAQIAIEKGRIDQARQYNDQCMNLAQASQDHAAINICSVSAGRIENNTDNFAKAEGLLQPVVRDPQAETSSRWEAHARLAELYGKEGLAAKAEQEFRQSVATIEGARDSIQSEELRVPFLSNAIQFYDNYIGFLVSRGRILDALQVAELSRAKTLAEGLGASPEKLTLSMKAFHPEQIAKRLEATLLFYWLAPNQSYLWAITSSGVKLFNLPGADEIDATVKAYREDLVGPRDVLATSNPRGTKLYEMLVRPIENLPRKGTRVVILPDGSLYGLNFETLLVPGSAAHYWIEDAVVSSASSLTLLAASTSRPASKSSRLLLIGDPVSPDKDYPGLPQARAEMDRVQTFFPAQERTVVSGANATASAYLQANPGNYSFIHFVAHGTANRTTPLNSAIILSKEGDSFKLHARDIVTRPLHARLVTVSSCFGAGTRAFAGEGLVGLSWAFLRAGAHNVIGALWEVSDISTPRLMDRLYRELSQGRDPATALRSAKLALLHSHTIYQKPFYWAAFELYTGS